MRFLSLFVGLIFALGVAVLAASNREVLSLSLWPSPLLVEMPMYIFILAISLFAFIFGALFVWLSDFSVRIDRFKKMRKIEQLEKQLKEKE